MATEAAILKILRGYIRKAWPPLLTLAATNSRRHGQILIPRAHGTTRKARKMATNAHGPSMSRLSPSATEHSGKSRENGPTKPMTLERVTPTARDRRAASTGIESGTREHNEAGSVWIRLLLSRLSLI